MSLEKVGVILEIREKTAVYNTGYTKLDGFIDRIRTFLFDFKNNFLLIRTRRDK